MAEQLNTTFYNKINTCFKRDMDHDSITYNCIIPTEMTCAEFELMRKYNIPWEATEKVDGECTSIHLIPVKDENNVVCSYKKEVHGKTNNANMRQDEVELLWNICDKESLIKAFTYERTAPEYPDGKDFVLPEVECVIFGETYGRGMQKNGNRYCKDHLKFICFDIRVGNIWLRRPAVEDICDKLGIDVVPNLGLMTLDEAIDLVKNGFKSKVAEDQTLDAEGVVLRAPLGMLDRLGNRIITKIKTKDFIKLEAKLVNNLKTLKTTI